MKGLRIRIDGLTRSVGIVRVGFLAYVIVSVGALGSCAQELETVATPTPTQPWWVDVYLEDQNTLLGQVEENIHPDGDAGACVRGELSESQRDHQQNLHDRPAWVGVPAFAYSLEYICAEALEHTHRLLDEGANGDRLTGNPPSLNSWEMEQLQPYTGECLELSETTWVIALARTYYESQLSGGKPMSRYEAKRWEEIQQDPRIPPVGISYYVPAKDNDLATCSKEPRNDTTDELAG